VDRDDFAKLEDIVINKGISIQVMLRAMMNLQNRKDLTTEYIFKSMDCIDAILDSFREYQRKYYEDIDGEYSG
jgi:hypothetical protein